MIRLKRKEKKRQAGGALQMKERATGNEEELQTQIKVAFLEKKNMRMLAELMSVRQENVCLRRLLKSKNVTSYVR